MAVVFDRYVFIRHAQILMTISFNIPPVVSRLFQRHILLIVLYVCILAGLTGANLYAALGIPKLYAVHAEHEKLAIATYLAAIRPLPQFQATYLRAVNTYGSTLHDELNKADNIRNEKIIKLERELEFNPKNGDILYALSLLYYENRNENRSREYTQKLQSVDPLHKSITYAP